jgi:membrane fusion protein, heavy metal efflux system
VADNRYGNIVKRPGTIVALAIVLLLVAVYLTRDRRTSSAMAEGEAPGALSYPRGPHGARLLSDSTLQLEMTIYETGVPPQFRVYAYDANLKPVAPADVDLRVHLYRLGGRIDTITFKPEEDYLQGVVVVEEPHSFDVKVSARVKGAEHRWEYSQIEGKVRLTDAQLVTAGITIDTVRSRRMLTTFDLPAQIKANETRLAHVVPRVAGVVTEVLKQEGDRVTRGELLAVVNSRELADAKSTYIEAEHHAEFAKITLDREEALWKKKISAERDYLEAKKNRDETLLALRVAEQKLAVLGLSTETIHKLEDAPPETMGRYEIRAPLDGRVIERDVTIGEAITADEDIFTVADLSSVWVEITVYAKDLANVREGQEATIRSTDLGTETTGRVSFVGPLVGQETRAATARIVLPNPQGKWRPGLFVNVQLVRESSVVPMVVAADAIQTFRDWQVVFVRYGDQFEARPLELGRSDGQWVEVLSGLTPGVRYASKNSFAVKAEIGKLGATHDH